MDRFCDYIRIYRHIGNLYDPFATPNIGVADDSTIEEQLVYEGACKAVHKAQYSVSETGQYSIYINDNDVDVDTRDTLYLRSNNRENDEVKLTAIEVKRYERNTVISAIHLKDGENS